DVKAIFSTIKQVRTMLDTNVVGQLVEEFAKETQVND
ncbi:TPA: phosphate acyltransferase, partial [Streptococcus pyogenes]